jgi:hypothetical protein
MLIEVSRFNQKKAKDSVAAVRTAKFAADAIGKLAAHFPKSLICCDNESLITIL